MKKTLILALGILVSASFAFAQDGGHIGLYSDAGSYADCNVNVAAPGAYTPIYVVHTTAAEANTSRFAATLNWTGATNLGFQVSTGVLPLGNILTGLTVTYGQCRQLPFLIGTWNFLAGTDLGPCLDAIQIIPDPNLASGEIQVIDCQANDLVGTGGKLTVNGNPNDCPCFVEVATQPSSWSKVKALYQ